MRWGIPDVEAWLQSLEPRVIDAWQVFESIEPEAFDERRAESEERKASSPMLSAAEAARRMARRMG